MGYVYILVNESMPGLVKIGKTKGDPRDRAKELSRATGVPTPFEVAYALFSHRYHDLEKQIHTKLKEFRLPNREFFRYPVEDAITLLKALGSEGSFADFDKIFKRGDPDAVKFLFSHLEVNPGSLDEMLPLLIKVVKSEKRSDPVRQQAIKWLKQAQTQSGIEAVSQCAKDFFRLGYEKGELEAYAAAISDYDKAIALKPDYADAYYNRGSMKAKSGQDTAAISDFDKAIALKPDYANAYNYRGVMKAKSGQDTAAISDYDKAIALKPDCALACKNREIAKQHIERQERIEKEKNETMRRREAERREAERQKAQRQEAQREAEQREVERKWKEYKAAQEKKTVVKVDISEAERKAEERKIAERREAERKAGEQREAAQSDYGCIWWVVGGGVVFLLAVIMDGCQNGF